MKEVASRYYFWYYFWQLAKDAEYLPWQLTTLFFPQATASGQATVSVPHSSFPLGIKKNWKIQAKVLGNKNEEEETRYIWWIFFFFFFQFFPLYIFLCYRFYILSFSIDLYFYSMHFFCKYSFAAPFFASFASVLPTLFPSSNFFLSLCEYQTVLIAYSDQ